MSSRLTILLQTARTDVHADVEHLAEVLDHDLTCAVDGPELRARLETNPVDLILRDLDAEAADDFATCRQCATENDATCPEVWLIADSATPLEQLDEARVAGARDILFRAGFDRSLDLRLDTLVRLRAAQHKVDELRAEHRLVRDSIQTGIVEIDAETLTIVDANTTATRLMQTPREDLVGRNCKDVLCTDDGDGCPVLEGRFCPQNAAGIIRRSDDEALPVLKTVVTVDFGDRTRLLDCFVDASELTQKQADLQKQEAAMRAMLEGARDGIIMMTPDGQIASWNRAAEQIFGHTSDEVIGRNLHRILAPEQTPAQMSGLARFRETGQGDALGQTTELVAKHKDGSLIPVELSLSAVELDGQWHALGIVRDIADRKAAEEQLRMTLEELEAIFESSLVGILVMEDRVVTKANGQVGRILGYEPEELIGQDPRILHLSQENYEEFGEEYYWQLAEREIIEVEFPMRHKSGRPVWCLFHGKAIAPPDLSKGAVWVITDITSRKWQEFELGQAKNHLQRVLDTAATAVFTVDADMSITSVNRAFCTMTGYSEEEALGQSCRLLKGDTCMKSCSLFDLDRSDPIAEQVCTIQAKDGKRLTIRKNAQVLWDDYGRVSSGIESFVDITELVAAREAAEDSTRAKADFLANMSHEIRTPMNGVLGIVGLLNETHLDEEQREYCRRITASAESLLAVINDILDFSRIEAGKLPLDETPFNLRELVEETSEYLAFSAQEKGLEFVCDIAQEVADKRRGDAGRIRQILTNLVGNAVKFTSEGEVTVFVYHEPGRGGEPRVRFEVTDTGIGIAPETVDRLFESFAQADSSTTRRFGGTGLGLTIAQQLTQLMGGEIGVESEVDKGSRFWVSIPLPVLETKPKHARTSALVDQRVLVVDDNETNRLVLMRRLTAWGARPAETDSGPRALQLLRQAAETDDAFVAAVIDHEMPGMDGEQLGREIQKNPDLTDTHLIMLTSLGQLRDAIHLRELGIAACLTKPVRATRLKRLIETVLTDGPAPEEPQEAETAASANADTDLTGLRVLVAEDNPTNLLIVVKLLRKLQIEPTTVTDGRAALDALRADTFDLVLMDIQMPNMDGFEATRQIRAADPSEMDPRIPVVALTAHAMQGDRDVCLEAGMNDYVTKPIRFDALRQAIERQLAARTTGV